MSDDITLKVLSETIGYHKGALAALAKERDELMKRVRVIEQIMEMHLQALQDFGIELSTESEKPDDE